MRGLTVQMWPGKPLSDSYFGLVRRLVNACPWLEVIKRSVCIEGACRAFSRAKVHWAKMDAEKLVKEGRRRARGIIAPKSIMTAS